MVDRHPGWYRTPAERVVDPVEKAPGKPIIYYLGVPFKFLANLFLAVLGMIAVGLKVPAFYFFLSLVSCVGVGALNDINTTNHGTIIGAQVALVIFAVLCFFTGCERASRS